MRLGRKERLEERARRARLYALQLVRDLDAKTNPQSVFVKMRTSWPLSADGIVGKPTPTGANLFRGRQNRVR